MQIIEVETSGGPGRLTLAPAEAALRGVALLGHGAGGGVETVDLDALAATLPGLGVAVARYEQPWRVAGRRVAGPPASLDRGWLPALEAVADAFPGVPLVVGGRSAGARVACRCFAAPAVGVLALSFPLHAPGHPEKTRLPELAGVAAPVLLVAGERDPFGSPVEFAAALASPHAGPRTLVTVPGQAHSFKEKKASPGAVGALVAAAASDFITGLLAP